MASGQVLGKFFAFDNEPPAAAFAVPTVRANGQPALRFDGATDWEAIFSDVLSNYGGGGVTVNTFWAMASAISGSFRVQGAFDRMPGASDSFDAFQSAGAAAPGTLGAIAVVTLVFSNAQIDGLLNGELYRFKIRRDADGTTGTDDITSEAHLLSVEVREI